MKQISSGIQVVWTIASGEAYNLYSYEIEPEHFLLGILSLQDVTSGNINYYYPNLKIEEIEGEIKSINEILVQSKIDIQILKGKIRESVREVNKPNYDLVFHRSQKTKDFFNLLFTGKYRDYNPDIVHFFLLIIENRTDKIGQLLKQSNIDITSLINNIHMKLNTGQKVGVKAKGSFLNDFGRNLTTLAKEGKLNMVVGRDSEIRDLGRVLLQKSKTNAILTGEAGVGKTAVVEGLAQAIIKGNVPDILKAKEIIEITMSALVSGTKYRGEFEERLEKILKEVRNNKDIVLFIDEIHTIIGAGSAEGSMDASNILKPELARGEIQVIGATTTKEYRKFFEKDQALERRFQVIKIEEPSRNAAIEIVKCIKGNFENHYGVKVNDNAIVKAVDLSIKYLPDFKLPDKAIDIIEKAFSSKVFPSVYASMDDKIKIESNEVNETDIIKAISKKCGIPIENLTKDDKEKLLLIEEFLSKRVIGQHNAVHEVSETIKISKAGLKDPKKPMGVFLFAGPTGVGKTELAKAIAEFLFGDSNKLIRFDMSEYMEKHQISKLIGAPPGYQGYDEEGLLISKARSNPYSVILFDEIEKAHTDIYNLFLQIFDEGRLTGSHGRTADFKETIIILTSNLGTKESQKIKHEKVGFKVVNEVSNIEAEQNSFAKLNDQICASIKKHFSPELINRISKIIAFTSLDKKSVYRILEKVLGQIQDRLIEKSIIFEMGESVKDYLINKGYSKEYGVRNLERIVEKEFVSQLSDLLIRENITNCKVIAEIENNKLKITKSP